MEQNESIIYISPTNYKNSNLIMNLWKPKHFLLFSIVFSISILLSIIYLSLFQGSNIYIILLLIFPSCMIGVFTIHLPVYQNFFGYFHPKTQFRCMIQCARDADNYPLISVSGALSQATFFHFSYCLLY